MTTLPKAKKFRLRRSSSSAEGPAGGEGTEGIAGLPQRDPLPHGNDDDLFDNHDDGFGSDEAGVPEGSEAEIDAIRREGLTGRQLRMARRVAQKRGLAPVSDFDAVRLLRKRGIDPFERSTMLELVIGDGGREEAGAAARDEADEPPPKPIQLPQTVVTKPSLPSTHVLPDEARVNEIHKIQQDIARRRRRKLMLLVTRLAFFVGLPTLIAAYYFYSIATPLYATKSEFVIQKADVPAGGGLGGLFSGTQFATSQDSITVQSYLQSRDAMLRLDQEVGFKSHFSAPGIDPIRRLPDGATNEQAYKLYRKLVKIGFDPTEGIVKMEVVAADPEVSKAFSLALLRYAEEQVDQLTQRLRADQMQGARDSFAESERKMQEAQARVLELQEKLGVLDPASETSSLMGQISTFEVQLQEKRLALQQLLDNAQPNRARVDGIRGDIQRLESLIADLRSQLTTSGDDSASLARISGELRMAEVDLQTRQALMQQSLTQLETARIEANRQVRYLSLGVSPVAPDEPTYPRRFESTMLVMLIFAGIYLMMSLTASILREQVTA